MSLLADLAASPHLADLVLGVLALEAAALALLRRRFGQGPGLVPVAPFLVAGTCLVLALRGALAGAGWPWVLVPLLGALAAHLVDLARRGRPGE